MHKWAASITISNSFRQSFFWRSTLSKIVLSSAKIRSSNFEILGLHLGQPAPAAVREITVACHSCPRLHRHHTLRLLPNMAADGVSEFLSGCQSFAISG